MSNKVAIHSTSNKSGQPEILRRRTVSENANFFENLRSSKTTRGDDKKNKYPLVEGEPDDSKSVKELTEIWNERVSGHRQRCSLYDLN